MLSEQRLCYFNQVLSILHENVVFLLLYKLNQQDIITLTSGCYIDYHKTTHRVVVTKLS